MLLLYDNDQATLDVLNGFVQIGIEDLSEGKPCFINFTDTLLENEMPSYFHPKMIVIEILETVTFSEEFIDICKKRKDQGYKIALDDFELKRSDPNFNNIINLADIVKIDIQKTSREEQAELLPLFKQHHIQLLAEKVETREEYEQCLKDGFDFFQGYFFCKPVILSTNDVTIQNHNLITIISDLSQPEPNIDQIANKIERDVSLSYKILKLINSPALRRLNEIKSIKQAIMMLGLKELRKWFYFLYIRKPNSTEHPIQHEITKMSMTRAKASELIAIEIGKRSESSSYFLLGMFSLIDTLLNQPLADILEPLPLDIEIKHTLLGVSTSYKEILDVVILIEQGKWNETGKLVKTINIEEKQLSEIYFNALKWTQDVLAAVEK